jgi:hypothetical protein
MPRSLAPLSLVLVLASPALAQEAPRVVVEPFGGPRGGAVRGDLVASLEENGVEIIGEAEVRRASERLGIGRRPSDEEYVQLARELRVSAFIDGYVRRQRRSWGASVRVRNAADGTRVGSASWGGRTAATLNAVRRNGHSRLADYLASTSVPGAAPAAQNTGGERPWYQQQAEDPEEPGEDPNEDDPEEPRELAPASTRYDAFRLALLGGTLYRFMDTTVSVYALQRMMPAADPARAFVDERRSYASGGIGHFELGGLAELYPGAFGDQPFPYLGVVLSFTHSIAVQSNGINRNTGDNVAVPTNQLDFYVGARGRYRFGAERREPEIRFDAGWGTFLFELGLAELQLIELDTIIPPMQHGYVYLGAGFSYGIVPTYLTVGVDVGYRIGTNIGGDTRNVWGTRTAPSNGFEMGIEIKTEIPEIAQGIFATLRFSYFQFTTDFNGQVGCAQPNACSGYMDPWSDPRLWEVWPVTPPAPGSPRANVDDAIGGPRDAVNDNYIRLQLAIGYSFY